jgi:hypothetical protein
MARHCALRSAFLKEWGRVKVLVLVVSSVRADAGAPGIPSLTVGSVVRSGHDRTGSSS